jgi:NAD(P) transhydrogenase subunit alpha
MKQGSVIVDMAAEQGGNCECTVPGEVVVRHGVTIIGYKDLPSRLAKQASTLYANNLFRLMEDMLKTKSIDGDVINVNMQDEVLRGTTVVDKGEVTWPPPAPKLSVAPAAPAAKPVAATPKAKGHGGRSGPMTGTKTAVLFGAGALVFLLAGRYAPASFLGHFTVFVLACFVGYMVVWNVTPALHTPLMSVTNAISGIIVIGGMLQVSGPLSQPAVVIGAVAILLATINIAGGFLVTQRMLRMFVRR